MLPRCSEWNIPAFSVCATLRGEQLERLGELHNLKDAKGKKSQQLMDIQSIYWEKRGKQKTKKQERTCANALTYMTGQQREKQYRWLNVLQQLNRATLALKQCLCTVHDLPDNLLQVSLFFKQVIDYFQECLKTSDRKRYHWHYSQQSKAE